MRACYGRAPEAAARNQRVPFDAASRFLMLMHGVLLVSQRHRRAHPIERAELQQIADAELPGSADVGACRMGDFEGLHATYAEDDQRWHRFICASAACCYRSLTRSSWRTTAARTMP
jgi:hypothetical protein